MKKLKYQLCTKINHGAQDDPQIEQVLSDVTLGWSAANEEVAKREAYNGEYEIIDDGEPEPVIPPTNEELASSLASVQSASAVAFVALCEVGTLDMVTASEHADLFLPWAYPITYTVGQLRRHNGKLYKCTQPHTSQADWAPDKAASLWSVAADPGEEWPAWSQPVGAHDAYAKGAKVSHKGKHWTSNEPNNVWEPGVYGWTEDEESVEANTASVQNVETSDEESYRLPNISEN